MDAEAREVLLEVYINGVLHSVDSYLALDGQDVQLEFKTPDAIYDLLSRSASQDVDVKLQVLTNDRVSISYCSPGEMHLQLEANENHTSVCEASDLQPNRNDGISELKNPPLVIHAEDLSKLVLGALVQAPPEMDLVAPPEMDLLAPSEPKWVLVDAADWYSPCSSVPEPDREWDQVDSVEFCAPGPSSPDPDDEEVFLPSQKWDVLDSVELRIWTRSSPWVKKNFPPVIHAVDLSKFGRGDEEPPRDNIVKQMWKSMKKRFQRVSRLPWRKVSVGQPEVDLLAPEESCVPDPRAPEPEPEMDLVDTEQLFVPDTDLVGPPETDLVAPPEMDLLAPSEPKWVLVDAADRYSPCSSVPEPDREWDQVDSVEFCAPGPSSPDPDDEEVFLPSQKWDVLDSVELRIWTRSSPWVKKNFPPVIHAVDLSKFGRGDEEPPRDNIVKQMWKSMKKRFQRVSRLPWRRVSVGQPEVDLLAPEESCVPDPRAPEPEPEMDLVDTEQLFVPETDQIAPPDTDLVAPSETDLVAPPEMFSPGSSAPEPEPDRECAPGPSSPDPDSEEDLDDLPERKWNLLDSMELNVRCRRIPKPPPPGPNLLFPEECLLDYKISRLQEYVPLTKSQLEERLKQPTELKEKPGAYCWPMIIIGNENLARNRDLLEEYCISHIINAAAPKKHLKYFLGTTGDEVKARTVDTGSRFYRGLNINYCSVPGTDPRCDISEYFKPVARFIHKALKKEMRQVVICCKHGVEQSVTLLLAYLMICRDLMLEEAIDYVIKRRRIVMSGDVLEKLMLLNAELVPKRIRKLQKKRKTARKPKKVRLR